MLLLLLLLLLLLFLKIEVRHSFLLVLGWCFFCGAGGWYWYSSSPVPTKVSKAVTLPVCGGDLAVPGRLLSVGGSVGCWWVPYFVWTLFAIGYMLLELFFAMGYDI